MRDRNKVEDLLYNLVDKEKNIYEVAELYHQARSKPAEYLDLLRTPGGAAKLSMSDDGKSLLSGNQRYAIMNDVVDFIGSLGKANADASEWAKLNEQFLNYHRSLNVYTLVNSMPIGAYLGCRSGMAELKDKTIVDIGGGTGHVLASFFYYPESLTYYLVDPNLRLLHDQFIRIFPKLCRLKMRHVLAFAEELPFCDNMADVVMSLSSIDHFKDYKAFFREAWRICKPGGQVFVSSHLDVQQEQQDRISTRAKLFSNSIWERVTRYLYYRRHRVGHDDHTYHFTSLEPFVTAATEAGFVLEQAETYKRYFFIVARKPA